MGLLKTAGKKISRFPLAYSAEAGFKRKRLIQQTPCKLKVWLAGPQRIRICDGRILAFHHAGTEADRCFVVEDNIYC
jgi:hypothetical protein